MISNSTPLISLAKINKLIILKKLFNKIIIPNEVKNEVILEGKPGYLTILKAIEEGWILIKNPKNNPDYGLHKGENQAINLAKERKDSLLIDDSYSIKVANSLNIDCIRTTKIIILSLKNKIINKKEAKELINNLVKTGYYLTTLVYTEILKIIDEN